MINSGIWSNASARCDPSESVQTRLPPDYLNFLGPDGRSKLRGMEILGVADVLDCTLHAVEYLYLYLAMVIQEIGIRNTV